MEKAVYMLCCRAEFLRGAVSLFFQLSGVGGLEIFKESYTGLQNVVFGVSFLFFTLFDLWGGRLSSSKINTWRPMFSYECLALAGLVLVGFS